MIKTYSLSTVALVALTLAGCQHGSSTQTDEAAYVVDVAPKPQQAAVTASETPTPAPCVVPSKVREEEKVTKADNRADSARKNAVNTADVAKKLRVKRLVVTEGVKNREPVEAKDSFQANEVDRLYAFVEVENGAEEETEITVAFEPEDGSAKGNVTLSVGASPRWRTWAFTRAARTAGAWTAIVRGPDGTVLARTPFEITL